MYTFIVNHLVFNTEVGPMENMNDTSGRAKNDCIRLMFEQGERVRCYEVCMKPPNLGIFTQRFNLRSQMDADNLSLSDITERLRCCAESNGDVEKVTMHYTGRGYTVVVLLRELNDEILSEVYDSFELACQEYVNDRPIINVIGPRQRDCFALSAADSYMIYSNGDTSDVPDKPTL